MHMGSSNAAKNRASSLIHIDLSRGIMLALHDEMIVCVVIAIQSIDIVDSFVFNETWVAPEESSEAPHEHEEYEIENGTVERI